MLFIHDHTFILENNSYYTTGSLNQRIMDRYKKWFGNVSVFARKTSATDKNQSFIREENRVQGIDFLLVDKSKSFKRLNKCYKKIYKAVSEADCVVVRMSIFGALGIRAAKKLSKPYMVEMVACPWDSLWYHSFKGKVFAPFMTLLTKKICRQHHMYSM